MTFTIDFCTNDNGDDEPKVHLSTKEYKGKLERTILKRIVRDRDKMEDVRDDVDHPVYVNIRSITFELGDRLNILEQAYEDLIGVLNSQPVKKSAA